MREVFLKTFGYLIYEVNNYKPMKNTLEILDITNQLISSSLYWSLNIVDIENEINELDNISKIIDRIMIGERICLQDIPYIKTFLKNMLNKFKYEHDNRRGWRYVYPEMYEDVYEIEENIMYTLQDLLVLMEIPPFDLFEMITSIEKVSLKNVCYEKKLPYDIERYTSEFIGF